jgi:ParB family transcriptional regulator, chromosome partitioning protein
VTTRPEPRAPEALGDVPKLAEKSPRIFRRIATSLLREPHDAMRHAMDDDALEELRQSIRQIGVLQPLCVVPAKDGARAVIVPATEKVLSKHEAEGGLYEVRAGHRRLLAARGINLESLPCIVFLDVDLADRAIMYHENAFREDPTDYDKAVMYAEQASTPGITEAELSRMFGRGIAYIYERMKILNWPEDVRAALHERRINYAIGRQLAAVKDPAYCKYFLNMAVMQGATSNLVRNWIQEFEGRTGAATPPPPKPAVMPVATTSPPVASECFVCGPKPSYELRTALVCGDCLERLEAAKSEADSMPQPAPDGDA